MLLFRSHWHFATERNPARERRLCWFADDQRRKKNPNPNDPNAVPEDAEAAKAEIQDTETARGNILDVSDKFRKKIERLNPIVAKATANSPVAIREIATLLKNQDIVKELKHLKQKPEEVTQILDRYYASLLKSEQKPEDETALTEMLQDMAEAPRVALKIAEMFEERLGTYDEQARFLKGVSLNACARATEQMDPEQIGRLMEKGSALTADDIGWVDQTLRSIGINPANLRITEEERKDIEKYTNKKLDGSDFDRSGLATPKRKVEMLREALDRARVVLTMEKNDSGSKKETTLENTDVIRGALAKQSDHAKEHLKRVVAARAEELRAYSKEFRQYLGDTYGKDDEKAKNDLGIGTRALEARIIGIESTIAEAMEKGGMPETDKPGFIEKAGEMLGKLDELSPLRDPDMRKRTEFLVAEGKLDREYAEAWAARNAKRVERAITTLKTDPTVERRLSGLRKTGEGGATVEELQVYCDVAKRAAAGDTTPADWNFLRDYCGKAARERMNTLLLTIEHPWLIEKAREDRKIIEKDETPNTKETRETVQRELEETTVKIFEGGINGKPKLEALKHTTAVVARVPDRFRMKLKQIGDDLRTAGGVKPPKPFAYGEQLLRKTRRELSKVREAVRMLDEFYAPKSQRVITLSMDSYKRMAGADTVALYNQQLGVIYLNEEALSDLSQKKGTTFAQEKEDAIFHERGHAIVDVLLRRTSIFPGLLADLYTPLEQLVPGDAEGRSFEEILLTRAKDWELGSALEQFTREEKQILEGSHSPLSAAEQDQLAANRAKTRLREVLFDEFINKYASWEHGSEKSDGFSPEDVLLFQAFDPLALGPKMDTDAIAERVRQGVNVHSTQAPSHDAEPEEHAGGEQEQQGQKVVVGQRIKDMQDELLLIYSFIEGHPKIRGIDQFTGWVHQWNDAFGKLIKEPFYNPQGNPRPEASFSQNLDNMEKDFLRPAKEQMENVIKAEADLSNVEGGGHHGWFHSLQMISLMDIYEMCAKAKEDLARMWKHRGDNVQSSLGEALTKWIPTNEIWGLKYFGQLKHEYHRRLQEAELHEVGIWKEALKNLDGYELQEMLGKAKEKEQLRGIIELLIEKGRLDLNDEHLWHTLMELSGMHGMPVTLCKQNDVLRDKWLQKMVTAIWTDKDKFFEWRQSNDSGFQTGKGKFTATVDQLSNVSGGLAGTLKRQLELWVHSRDAGESVPDEVNPHLYEEILHYAMRNGKMTMEEKLFYLVQGVRFQLLSIDRLRILAGEKGEILNIFPFIDYFYGHNNSLSEVTALGHRLEEGQSNKFTPGPKTTLWLHMELLRDEGAKLRMSKAMSGARTEKVDHEDFPTLVSQMSFAEINEITGVLSGSRFKMSYEAAKNTYTGFSTKFKVFGSLAQLAAEGKATFTDQDVEEVTKSIVAYVNLDNQLTSKGKEGARISLSFDQMRQGAPSVASGLSVKDYRDSNQKFVYDLVRDLNLDWEKIGDGFTQDKFMRKLGDEEPITDKTSQEANFKAMERFSNAVREAIRSNPSKLLHQLVNNSPHFKQENVDEANKPEKCVSVQKMQEYLQMRSQHEKLGAVKTHVGHH